MGTYSIHNNTFFIDGKGRTATRIRVLFLSKFQSDVLSRATVTPAMYAELMECKLAEAKRLFKRHWERLKETIIVLPGGEEKVVFKEVSIDEFGAITLVPNVDIIDYIHPYSFLVAKDGSL